MQFRQFAQYGRNKIRPALGMANEIAIVSRVSGQKTGLPLGGICSQCCHSNQALAPVGQYQERFHRRPVSSLHGQGPFIGVENLRMLHSKHQPVPLIAELLVLRNLSMHAYAQGSPAILVAFENT